MARQCDAQQLSSRTGAAQYSSVRNCRVALDSWAGARARGAGRASRILGRCKIAREEPGVLLVVVSRLFPPVCVKKFTPIALLVTAA
jgi:hypothetical protein